MKRMLSLILALVLFCLPCALAETADPAALPQLTVTGSATVSLPADAAMIMLGVREIAPNVRDAQAAVNTKIAAIRAALVGIGIDNADIDTESLYVYANYNYSSGLEEVISYSANNTLRITVRDIAQAGAVIDTAFAAGANTLENTTFFASDDSAARDQAYAEAVAAALHKGDIIAAAAGMNIHSIASITENVNNGWYETGIKMNSIVAEDAAAAGADIQASNVNVTAEVSITFTLSK